MNPFRMHRLRVIISLLAYAVGLFALHVLFREGEPFPLKFALILLPILPVLYLATATIRAVSALDEMQRKMVTESMAFSGIATGFTCFSYLFVHDIGGPEFRPEWAFYMMWAYYGVGRIVAGRRYE